MMTDDVSLLKEYARGNSEEAFATLVSRHVGLVYSVALRQVGDPHLAEEITQVTFIILARKAASLSSKTILPGWLCRTARYASANALTIQRRRQHREQEAHMQAILNEPQPDAWAQIAPLLDTALAQLGEKDHDAIVLRFFQNKNFNEISALLGASEEAAKKRVSRALEKLRRFFTRHGVVSTTATIAGVISVNSVQAAPTGLAESVATIAMTKGVAAGSSTVTLIKGALKIMAWTKAKTTVVAGAALILAAGVATLTVHLCSHRSNAELSRADSGAMNPAAPDNPKIADQAARGMTADQAVRGMLKDWAKGDWDEFFTKFGEPGMSRAMYDKAFTPELKSLLAGLEIVSVGEPTNSFPNPNMWCVPTKIRLKDGTEGEPRLNVAQNPQTKRWHFVGGL